MRQGLIIVDGRAIGTITEKNSGDYCFAYEQDYLEDPTAFPISLTLPLRAEPYESKVLFPFFDGLIPEGWLLDLSIVNWKLKSNDRMGLLLTTCEDCIGHVSIKAVDDEQ